MTRGKKKQQSGGAKNAKGDGPAHGIKTMFPSLHDRVVKALEGAVHPVPKFHNFDATGNREYSTNIMGKFRCPNKSCKKAGWGSKTVAIVIRCGYDTGDNDYNAVVFNQRCNSCNTLGSMTLDEMSYVERVAYRLKVWADVDVTPPPMGDEKGPPHEKALCEGCKAGYCKYARMGYY